MSLTETRFGKLIDMLRTAAEGRTEGKAEWNRALDRTAGWLVREHPGWAAALFDHSFLQHEAADLLGSIRTGQGSVSAHMLAERWASSLGTPRAERRRERVAELQPVADEFLARLRRALAEELTARECVETTFAACAAENATRLAR